MKWSALLADLDEDKASARDRIQRLVDKWQPILGVQVRHWDLRKMACCWGSTNRKIGHTTFNPDIAKLPARELEYLVVHELVHHLTDGHDKRFYALMDRHVPGWRRIQAKIEEPLKHHS